MSVKERADTLSFFRESFPFTIVVNGSQGVLCSFSSFFDLIYIYREK